MDKNKKVGKLLLLAVLAEAVILTDSLAMFVSNLFSQNIAIQIALAFFLTYIFWCIGIFLIDGYYKKQVDIQFKYCQKPSYSQIMTGLVLMIVTCIISYNSWGGFKVAKELINGIRNGGVVLGIAYFIAQYLYYFMEAILMVMILSFAQEAGTMFFGNKKIPYGGIVLSIIWGLPHIAFHGVADGLIIVIYALLYGYVFLVMNKNIKYALPMVFLMFIL